MPKHEQLPQFYPNTLPLPQLNHATLAASLADLRTAVLDGVNAIESGDPPGAGGRNDGRGIFSGDVGIAVAYLRLARQTQSLQFAESSRELPDFASLAAARIPPSGPDVPLRVGGLSSLASNSPIPAAVLRILHRLASGEASAEIVSETETDRTDLLCLRDAVALALGHGATAFYHGRHMGADEVLFGRAGLLWVLLNLRERMEEFAPSQREILDPVVAAIPSLVRAIVGAGREGSADYIRHHGERDALPLMWVWMHGHYGLGWAHGLTGIISILLSCRPDEITPYLPELGNTLTTLSRLCIAHNGHLPTSIPPRSTSTSRESPLVQICHGAPAFLALLGTALKIPHLVLTNWTPDWDAAIGLATQRVWDEGILSKGGGLCHGIAGNAWPFLLLHDVFEYKADMLMKARENYAARTAAPKSDIDIPDTTILTGDFFLARALAMLLHARETRPFVDHARATETPAHEHRYRMPDHPFSLFEGLSGTLCAWADACAVLRARLRKMELGFGLEGGGAVQEDAVFRECMAQQLGFPFLGGNGVRGVL
ncbi:lanthionine synthetase C family protein [Aspergillus lucknowensis]|uniref:Lanthionine synthetase C family protein n=1 Tax=Aspergillus lucknowensis TaxID=176173 RepID=A0ABR4LSI9_9EURO